ncbi:type II toxin-antitoxin system RelE/ParE family toxin [Mariprofundus ferrooxydans]|uniref:type II toxin-antitoxin system RelE/ParE family toxin n=1 Tax=Mariprofundus ferrooxydans TaxID=314344 RepID=UPI0014316E19|nr:type II toxin-antitoxin system RelE/ParE family toxin [Mariprofundus ferrooxydans]
MKQQIKDLYWVGATRKELGSLPPEVVDLFGYALHLAQSGMKHTQAKPLKGLGGVLEVVEDFKSDTYRAVYTVKFGNAVYVLYCFQKKSKKGIKTPKPDMDIIRDRLKQAKAHAEGEGND